MRDFTVYAEGLCYASVCTSLPREEVESRMNRERPPGTELGWRISDEPTFKGGEPNPCPCHDQPDTHRHYLMVC